MIAIALAAEPDIVIADEPTTALDVTIQAQILDLLAELQRSAEDGDAADHARPRRSSRKMAHRVALMYAGQIVEVAEAKEFFARPLHPYARNAVRSAARHAPSAARGWRRSPARCRRSTRASTAAASPIAARNVHDDLPRGPPPLLQPIVRTPCPLRAVPEGAAVRPPVATADPADRADRAADPPTGDALLDVRDYRVWFPDPQRPAEAHGRPRQGRRRRFVRSRRRPHAGARRRIGLRQDDRRQGAAAASARHCARSKARRGSTASRSSSSKATHCATARRTIADHLPGSVRVAQSAHARQEILEEGILSLRPEVARGRARRARAPRWSTASACDATRWRAIRTSSPAASGSGWRLRARSPSNRG